MAESIPGYRVLVDIYDRMYQKVSLEQGIYLIPVDEVCFRDVGLRRKSRKIT